MTDIDFFFALIRSGLKLTKPPHIEKERFSSEMWKQIIKEAQAQAVSAVVFDGMQRWIEDGLGEIDKQLMLQWYGHVMMIERQNLKVNHVMGEITELLNKNDIPFVIMKGQTVAHLYPAPLHRQPGDIDILVKSNDFTKACKVFEATGAFAGEIAPEKHTEFSFHHVVIELHHTMIDLSNKKAIQYIQNLSLSSLKEDKEVSGITVPCFRPAINCVYMLSHMVHHLLTEGLGLRQVCDWMMLMKRIENGEYGNIPELKYEILTHLNGFRLQKAYNTFLALGIKWFSLSETIWGYDVNNKTKKRADKLLEYILESGNFGRKQNKKKDSHSLKGNVSNMLLYLRNLLRMRSIAPTEVRSFLPTRLRRWIQKKNSTK